eukprot:scaffold32651_cov112-Isochrysis_galbana.AAC.1
MSASATCGGGGGHGTRALLPANAPCCLLGCPWLVAPAEVAWLRGGTYHYDVDVAGAGCLMDS